MFTPIGFFAAPAGGGSIITDNLEQWLQVETGTSAGFLADSSGNGRNATLTNGELVYNTTNDWWDINASNWDPNVDTGYVVSDFCAESWTIECWFNVTTAAGGTVGVVHNRTSTYGTNFITLGANSSSGNIDFYVVTTSGGEYFVQDNNGGSGWTDSNWHHVAVTYDVGVNTMTLYIDTVSKDTVSLAGACNRSGGLRYMGKFLRSSRYFSDASFGSYRVYSAALSGAEVLQNYDAEKAHYGL